MNTRIRIWICFYFAGTLALIGIAHHMYQTTTAGRTISESLWGLNQLHYSKILEKVSRNEGRELEKTLLGDHSKSLIEPPNLSYPSGIYPFGIQVKVDLPPRTTGYYSLDGSVPTPRHNPVTASDIPISEPTVLRVKAFDDSSTSRVATAEYIVTNLGDFPVASLVMDPVYLFERHSGIYANPKQKGRGWERPATLSIFGPKKGDSLSMDVRVRIQGGASRGSSNSGRKSLRIILQDNNLEFANWFGAATDNFSPDQTEWVLRHAPNKRQLWSDRFILRVAQQLGLTAGTARPLLLHINGKLWGLYDIIERANAEFVSGKENGRDFVLLHGSPLVDPLSRSPRYTEWNEIYRFISENDLSDPAAFALVQNEIDLDSLIDYFALSIFMADSDRPQGNIDIYRRRSGPDSSVSKWKFAVWDFDGGLNYRNRLTDHDTLSWHLRDSVRTDLKPFGRPDNAEMVAATRLLRGLLKNPGFKEKFRDRFIELLDTTFSSSNLLATFQKMLNEYELVIPIEKQRFGTQAPWLLKGIVSLRHSETDFTYDERMAEIYYFISERPEVVKHQIEKLL